MQSLPGPNEGHQHSCSLRRDEEAGAEVLGEGSPRQLLSAHRLRPDRRFVRPPVHSLCCLFWEVNAHGNATIVTFFNVINNYKQIKGFVNIDQCCTTLVIQYMKGLSQTHKQAHDMT